MTTFRPEIDGLRTISLFLVVFHHLGYELFSGGFIGVDVFFVISGFLITSIIQKEIISNRFSLHAFYKRRILRLAPAYFTVIITVSVVATHVLLPTDLISYFESVNYANFFLANFFMWSDVGGYFGVGGDFTPLLHLWSLAVEEQFYIFWPLFLIAVYKITKFSYSLLIFGVLLLLALAISEFGANNYLAASYYLMPTRAFELIVGALLVFIPPIKLNKIISHVLAVAGIVMIIWSGVTYTKETVFPGVNALVPCVGTALIILFSSHRYGIGKLISNKAMLYLGKLSYSGYLWHWPIIVLANIYLIEITHSVASIIILMTLMLSAFTYHYIEIPAKRLNNRKLRTIVSLNYVVPVSCLLLAYLLINFNRGFPARFSTEIAVMNEAINSFPNKERGRCNEGPVVKPLSDDDCILGIAKPIVDFLLIGDSHANHFTGMIDEMAKDANLRGYDITQSQTIYLKDYKRFYEIDDKVIEHEQFYARNNYLTSLLNESKYPTVILGGAFLKSMEFDYQYVNDSGERVNNMSIALKSTVDFIMAKGLKLFIIDDNPYYNERIQYCELNNSRFNLDVNCNLDIQEYIEQSSNWHKLLNDLQSTYSNLEVINPNEIICDSKHCHSMIDGIPLYKDNGHLNQMGSRLIGKKYIEQFGNPLSEAGNDKI
ncbi:acyltransferase family protein [Pseudoalteromonas sp. Z9A6]|uniref:acyltransferase family protein n=1 Tax=Pseudoalteromonas sp. Z9A6 TaxID=2686352 RepID=UPI0013FDA6CB|nr:acyltransferase family protein [Pseudoalteromonas sp. Z9A6]